MSTGEFKPPLMTYCHDKLSLDTEKWSGIPQHYFKLINNYTPSKYIITN